MTKTPPILLGGQGMHDLLIYPATLGRIRENKNMHIKKAFLKYLDWEKKIKDGFFKNIRLYRTTIQQIQKLYQFISQSLQNPKFPNRLGPPAQVPF